MYLNLQRSLTATHPNDLPELFMIINLELPEYTVNCSKKGREGTSVLRISL